MTTIEETMIIEAPFECAEGEAPGWLDENGVATSCVDNSPVMPEFVRIDTFWEEGLPVEDCDAGVVTLELIEYDVDVWLDPVTGEEYEGDITPTGNSDNLVIYEAVGCPVKAEVQEEAFEVPEQLEEVTEQPVAPVQVDAGVHAGPGVEVASLVIVVALGVGLLIDRISQKFSK